MIKGVFLDALTLGQNLNWESIQSLPVEWQYFDTTDDAQLLERIQEAALIVTNKVKINAKHLQKLKAGQQKSPLKLICAAATGMDHIDCNYAKSVGIQVKNVQGYATDAVIQHTIGMMIQLASQLPQYQQLTQTGAWHKSPIFCLNHLNTFELAHKTLGIIGYGRLGQGVANVARALGMKVVIAESLNQTPQLPSLSPNSTPQLTRIPLQDLLNSSDIVSLHCPLSDATRLLMNHQTFSWMKKGSLFINTARGGLVDETALIHALKTGHLSGAALDTLTIEPPSAESPLFSMPSNLLITPHSSWSTLEARQRLLEGISTNILSVIKEEK